MSHRLASLSVCSVIALAAAGSAQTRGAHDHWPWGTDSTAAAGLAGLAKRDLFNLGLLGAKAWDADRPEPEPSQRSGRRSFSGGGHDGEDAGPKRLVVRALFGGGPAQRAGIERGDVIVGAGQSRFDAGCFAPLADALLEAEAGDGKVALRVERGGEALDVVVKIPKGGKGAEDPTAGKQRDKILAAALEWLADHQSGDGGFPETLGGANGAVVQTCLAGLAWNAGGSSLRRGKHKAELRKAVAFVQRGLAAGDPLGGATGASWDQSTWGYAHAAVFFGELQLASKSKDLGAELQSIADELVARQEAGGGYGHGPGGENALGYVELNILGGYVLCGLGLARLAGCDVDEGAVERLRDYLRASASEDGGVGYSTAAGQKGVGNIGRSAGAWLGAVALGMADDPWTRTLGDWTRRHVGAVLEGHASLQQHVLLAGVAAAALGDEALAEFWSSGLRRDLVLARAPDGSFQPRPWHESLLMQSNTDVSMGEVWTTASWAIVLGARPDGKRGLPGWTGAVSTR